MGYSCSVKASFTLEAVRQLSEFDIDSKDYKYFIEIGRENRDGSITGTVYELKGDAFIDKQGYERRACVEKGGFKIDSQGKVIRFPGVSRKFFGMLEIYSIETYDRQYRKAN